MNLVKEEEMSRKIDVRCDKCGEEFQCMAYINFSIYCPNCMNTVYGECEYGYGPVTPYHFCIGNEVIGKVESEWNQYTLFYQDKTIKLNKTYYEAIHEAEKIILDSYVKHKVTN